jgi:hypothetical protein
MEVLAFGLVAAVLFAAFAFVGVLLEWRRLS